jgi:hypothetical protein
VNPQTFNFARKNSAWPWLVRGLIVAIVASLVLPQPVSAQAGGNLFLPFANNRSCSGLVPESLPFGVQMYGDTGASSPYAVPLAQTNSAWVRVSVSWSAVQPDDPDEAPVAQYRWSSIDTAFRAYTDLCMNVIATIGSAPDWAASGPSAPINPSELDDFTKFVTALVERYDGDGIADAPSGVVVWYWELYNEPDYGDAPDGGGWGNDGAAYAAMLKQVYPAIKNATKDPTNAARKDGAVVLFGGLAYDLFTIDGGAFVKKFLPDVLAVNGACESFDYMNFHFYPNNRSAWTTSKSTGLPEKTQAIRAAMGDCHKPLALTEVGWHSNSVDNQNLSSTPEVQSRHVVQLLAQAMANDDMKIIIWWMLYTPTEYPYDTGLITVANPPIYKPAFSVFQSTVQRLAAVQYEASLSSEESGNADLEVYRFRDASNRTFHVAWLNPSTTDETRALQLVGAKATVRDKFGNIAANITDAADGATDGKVTIQISGSPIFIYVD